MCGLEISPRGALGRASAAEVCEFDYQEDRRATGGKVKEREGQKVHWLDTDERLASTVLQRMGHVSVLGYHKASNRKVTL